MSIPTKAELAKNAADNQAVAARQRVEDDVKFFTTEISAAMRAGQSFYSHRTMNVSPEVQQRLRADFAPDWTLTFNNARTGCSISWK